jgi:hypothetical protein
MAHAACATQPHRADLPRAAEVAGQHGGEDEAVNDHRFGELGIHRGPCRVHAARGIRPAAGSRVTALTGVFAVHLLFA